MIRKLHCDPHMFSGSCSCGSIATKGWPALSPGIEADGYENALTTTHQDGHQSGHLLQLELQPVHLPRDQYPLRVHVHQDSCLDLAPLLSPLVACLSLVVPWGDE